MNKSLLVATLVCFTGCAGAQLEKDWKEKRGYSDQDITEIRAKASEYGSAKARAQVSSNAFNSAPITEFNSRQHAVFCSCVKKLGDKCRKKPDGLSESDRALWVKANAIDMDKVGTSMSFETNGMSKIDPDECI